MRRTVEGELRIAVFGVTVEQRSGPTTRFHFLDIPIKSQANLFFRGNLTGLQPCAKGSGPLWGQQAGHHIRKQVVFHNPDPALFRQYLRGHRQKLFIQKQGGAVSGFQEFGKLFSGFCLRLPAGANLPRPALRLQGTLPKEIAKILCKEPKGIHGEPEQALSRLSVRRPFPIPVVLFVYCSNLSASYGRRLSKF